MAASVADFQNLVLGQNGFIFWIAVAAITCGVSLLLTGIYLYLRRVWYHGGFRLLIRHAARQADPDARKSAGSSGALPGNPHATATQDEPLPAQAAGPAPVCDLDLGTDSLPQVLHRLREAANRLENLTDELVNPLNSSAESPLKHLTGDVEYVFRASRH